MATQPPTFFCARPSEIAPGQCHPRPRGGSRRTRCSCQDRHCPRRITDRTPRDRDRQCVSRRAARAVVLFGSGSGWGRDVSRHASLNGWQAKAALAAVFGQRVKHQEADVKFAAIQVPACLGTRAQGRGVWILDGWRGSPAIAVVPGLASRTMASGGRDARVSCAFGAIVHQSAPLPYGSFGTGRQAATEPTESDDSVCGVPSFRLRHRLCARGSGHLAAR